MERDTSDPVTGKSLSGPIMVCSLLMVAGLCWGLYDEAIGQRPWKGYQKRFAALYSAHLKSLLPAAATAEAGLAASQEVRSLDEQLRHAQEEAAPKTREIESKLIAV